MDYKELIIHRALLDMGFTKCDDNKYRRLKIHDFMNVVIDEYGNLCINAELEQNPHQIPITVFFKDELDKFKQWMILTHGKL